MKKKFRVEIDRETDGRWIGEVMEVPGAIAYGESVLDAITKAFEIALTSSSPAPQKET